MGRATYWTPCPCGKRGFADERDAGKALGRVQARRDRNIAGTVSRRGHVRESRVYACEHSELYHLTSESRRTYLARRGDRAV